MFHKTSHASLEQHKVERMTTELNFHWIIPLIKGYRE